MTVAAARLVAYGIRIATRKNVRPRSLWLSRCAMPSAITSCGTAEMMPMVSVFRNAFQK